MHMTETSSSKVKKVICHITETLISVRVNTFPTLKSLSPYVDKYLSPIASCVHKQTTNFVQSTTQAQPLGSKQTRVLDSADEDVQRAVCVDRSPGGVGHKASIRGDPVDNRIGVAPGLTAQSHTLTL